MKHITQVLDCAPVAALFVRSNSHYKAIPGVDAFDFERNALNFVGGVPGVYHPPCRSWGQLAHMAKPVPGERELAIWSMDMVRKHGGVLEHPYASRLWAETACGSFGVRDQFGGVLIPVFQSWWGHRAQKRTCFYIVGPVPEIPFSEKPATHYVERMCRAEREATPPELATWLINAARACA